MAGKIVNDALCNIACMATVAACVVIDHAPCRPSLQKGASRHRALSRLSREVSADKASMLSHAREHAADLACQAGTAKVLRAACEKLHHEQRMVKAMHHHQVLALYAFKAPHTCRPLTRKIQLLVDRPLLHVSLLCL